MSKPKSKPALVLDAELFGSVVVICQRCGWRAITCTRAGAWTAGALHLKDSLDNGGHGDVHAAHTARECARMARRRAEQRSQSPETKRHGTTRPSAHRSKPANRSRPSGRAGSGPDRSAG